MKAFIFFILCLGLLSAFDINAVRENIESIEKDTLTFPARDLKVGESGVVLTKNQSSEVIIAQAHITEINNGKATATFKPFELLKQKFLPTPINEPKVGDEVLFRSFYNRAIAIAPNQETYQYIIKSNPNIQFMHIDLFAAFLQQENTNDPQKKEFQKFCPKYSIGLLFIADSQNIKVFDCQNFAVFGTQEFQDSSILHTEAVTPFFSRITAPNKRLGSRLKSNNSKDYFPYYDKLTQTHAH
ncbi:plasminogen-binding N-terminal domain-containing protein [Helicobacter himalayensis]|uniref:plasminogen-binding N-terminal domain-containing protein n=1 Tax=Helicobacter himalayensis TaxID=1591088 RepID=UPI003D6F35FD